MTTTVSSARARGVPQVTLRLACLAALALVSVFAWAGDARGDSTAAEARAFTRPLPIPRRLRAEARPLRIEMRRARLPILPGARTPMWTYGGSFPGPTIEARAGRLARVRFTNRLPHGAGKTTVHLHGGHQPAVHDGQPDRFLIARGRSRTYEYPLTWQGRPQRGAFLWYHDHRMGSTGRNIWKGLAGMFIVRDRAEARLGLPRGGREIPLMLADRTFTADNRLPYPRSADTPPPSDAAVGEHVLVNGVPQPYLRVGDTSYRFRIVNASNFTAYNLELGGGTTITQIGTGQGLLPRPVARERILLGPSQRADIVVNFHGLLGRRVILRSVPRAQTEGGTGTAAADLLQFRVTRDAPRPAALAERLRPRPRWAREASTVPDRTWVFGLGTDAEGRSAWTINGRSHEHGRVDAEVKRGSVETWALTNATSTTHYIHMHGVPFALLERAGRAPEPWESGLDDTFKVDPGETILVAAKFADYKGVFSIHCHMLEHEDHGMMTMFRVVD